MQITILNIKKILYIEPKTNLNKFNHINNIKLKIKYKIIINKMLLLIIIIKIQKNKNFNIKINTVALISFKKFKI